MMPEARESTAFTVDPSGARVRKLLKPITGHQGVVSEVKLRPPTYREYLTHGDPSAMIVMHGAILPQEDLGIVARYIETLADCNPLLLEQADYRDAMALKEAVLDFFRPASASISTNSPTPSSSRSASTPDASNK